MKDLITHTTQWAKGDLLQGRIMFAIGLLLLIAAIAILRSNHDFLKGTLIPLGLLLIVLVGYGGFLAFTRGGHIQKVETLAQSSPAEAVKTELEKANRDHKAYSMAKKIWPVLIILVAGLYYVLPTDFLKGLSVGFIGLFLALIFVDVLLHHRLTPYRDALLELV